MKTETHLFFFPWEMERERKTGDAVLKRELCERRCGAAERTL
jgi:hypothetical protein